MNRGHVNADLRQLELKTSVIKKKGSRPKQKESRADVVEKLV